MLQPEGSSYQGKEQNHSDSPPAFAETRQENLHHLQWVCELPSPYQARDVKTAYQEQWRSRNIASSYDIKDVAAEPVDFEMLEPKATATASQRILWQLSGSSLGSSQRSRILTTPEKADPYLYSPLKSPSSIRLLEIEPGERSEPLKCQLFELHTNLLPEYEAISYVWGSNKLCREIRCNGKSLHLTESLDAALRRVRLKDRKRVVWADAICINQKDLPERGHQVKLMQQIYKGSKRVLAWLGAETAEHVQMAIDLINKICCCAANEDDKACFPNTGDMRWQALSAFYESSWFWRLWVIQEIASAPSGLLLWGDDEICWSKVGLSAAWLRVNGYEIFHEVPMVGVFNAYLMHTISEEMRTDCSPTLFRGLLTLTRQFRCTDPRDRVYAVLGLPHRDRDVSSQVEPDYEKSTTEVYFETARKILMGPYPIKMLGAVQHGPSLDQEDSLNLPSWAPQWHRLYTYRLEPGGRGEKMYNASTGILHAELSICKVTEPLSKSVLSVRGFLFRNVILVSKVFERHDMVCETWQGVFKTWESLMLPLRSDPAAHHNGFQTEKAYVEALTAGKDWYGEMANQKETFADFIAFWRYTISCLKEPEGRAMFSAVDDARLASHKSNGNGSSYERFAVAVKNGCGGRRIFIAKGGFIGLGPEAMKLGDEICVVAGSRVLLILRPQGEYHRLVGEAYIPGMMNGEAVEEWNTGGTKPLQTFQLQ